MNTHISEPATLRRQVGLGGAVLLGLGSMVGAGVFVSLGLGAGLVGPMVIGAIVLAGLLAMCNGLSSAQLAAAYPVAGGTYEYAHRVGWPGLGAVAGAMFLVAKSASAATAALGLAGYVLYRFEAPGMLVPGALAVIVMLTVVVLEGIRRTNTVNTAVVSATLAGLAIFVFVGLGDVQSEYLKFSEWIKPHPIPAPGDSTEARWPATPGDWHWPDFLFATALMFVAYTGYGRIATLGEEVHHPRRTIPIAIVVTVLACVLVYTTVAAVGVGMAGAHRFARASEGGAPLEVIALQVGFPGWATWAVTIAAVTAMLGVILNLILGLSRVALAMGRRGHLPKRFAKVDATGTTPGPAVLLVAAIVAGLVCVGSIKTAWSLSAVTVLIYYGITNAAALRLPPEHRLYPRVLSWAGLIGCLGLSVFVESIYWAFAGGLIALAWGGHALTAARRSRVVT
ncbi:MAG: APC family permease [Planctomycetota bacterium]